MVSLLHQVMHAVAIKRNGEADSISSISGLNLESVIKTLNDGVSLGRLVKIDDTFLLSPAGRMILDSEYDEKIIDKLGVIHEKFEPVLSIMVESIGRFANYSAKLIKALEKSEDGELEWVSDAKLDSYHTVWFELHEDLLRLLGRSREE